MIILLIIYRNKLSRVFSFYAGISYVLFAILQSVAFTQDYGFAVLTINLTMFLIISLSWFLEAFVKKNDFSKHKIPLWKYWVLPLAFIAFWYPANPETLMPDFNPIHLFTNMAGLAFCLMTPVYIAVLTIFHPKINTVVLRVTSLVGMIIAFYNIWVNFFIAPDQFWWNGILHLPLTITSVYGFVLSFKK